jgi:hypothetical protein
VWERREGLPGRACWLLLRHNLDGSEPRFSLATPPPETSLPTLARIAAVRWVIETDFQRAKGEAGLDEYEVRREPGWPDRATRVGSPNQNCRSELWIVRHSRTSLKHRAGPNVSANRHG